MPLNVTQEDFPRLWPEWQRLVALSPWATVFQTPSWLKTWWDHFENQWDLRLLAVRDGEQLMGIAPLMRKGDTIHFLADTAVCDYHDFIAYPGKEEQIVSSVLQFLRADEGITRGEFSAVRHGSPTLELLPRIAREMGFSCSISIEVVSPSMRLTGTWDQYVQGLNKKNRHELRRKFRRLEEVDPGYRCVIIGDNLAMSQEMVLFLEFMKKSRTDKEQFLNSGREGFFIDLAERLSQEGVAKLGFLEVANQRAAATLFFDYRGTYYLYNSGYDPAFSHLSAGLLIKALCIKTALDQGASCFDFLRGNEPYKYDLGGQDVPLYQLLLQR